MYIYRPFSKSLYMYMYMYYMCLEREKVVVERGEKIINAFPILLFSKIYILSLGLFCFRLELSFGFSPKKKLLGDMEKLYAI